MKLLVFAHTPPPHHGQSYMVQIMLEGFCGDCRNPHKGPPAINDWGIECYHVNAQLSRELDEIGGFQPRKLRLLLSYCLEAIWCRFRYGVTDFYYVPAPGQHGALFRDWVVMLLCRPFFRRIIFHWHAAGLAEWLEKSNWGMVRWITMRLLGSPDLSIVLSKYNTRDGQNLRSRCIKVVHNGIPDPCPEFERDVLPFRLARFEFRRLLLSGRVFTAQEGTVVNGQAHLIRLLFLAQCSREKGLFDAVESVAIANETLEQSGSSARVQLTVAGEFVHAAERAEFDDRIDARDLNLSRTTANSRVDLAIGGSPEEEIRAVVYAGFLAGAQKRQALVQCDCLCLPTFYSNENQPVTLIEAMAFGVPIVTTRWRSLPELFPSTYTGLVEIHSPSQLAEATITTLCSYSGQELRAIFVRQFTLNRHLTELARAFKGTEHS